MLIRPFVGVGCVLGSLEMGHVLNEALRPGTIALPLTGLPILPGAAIPWVIGVWACSAIAFTLGWHPRIAGGLLLLTMGYLLLMDERTYSNHLYLLCLLVLILVCADGATAGTLFRAQLSVVYAYAALAKINLSFLSGAVLLNQGHTIFPESWLRMEVLAPLALLALVAEAFLAVAFWSHKLRPIAWAVGIGLHAVSVVFVRDGRLGVLIFGLAMVGLYTSFGPAGDRRTSLAR